MNLSNPEDRNKFLLIGGFVVLALGLAVYDLSGTGLLPWGSGPAPAAAVSTAAAQETFPVAGTLAEKPGEGKKVGTTSGTLDPTLHMEAMLVTESVEYSGTGRNIFSAVSVQVVIPKPITTARPRPLPTPVVYTPPPGPPPPPPIDLKFFGTETSPDGTRRAFLLHGDDVVLASAGDMVLRRYRVISIAANNIEVEDMQYNNKQTLPLVIN